MTIEDTHCKLGNGRDWRDQIGSDRDWTQSPCEDISLIMVLAEFHQEISPKLQFMKFRRPVQSLAMGFHEFKINSILNSISSESSGVLTSHRSSHL